MSTATAKAQVLYTLAPFQDDFINGSHQNLAVIAGKGTGKTFAGACFVMAQIAEQPNSQGLIMLNTLQQTRDIFVQDVERMLKELQWPYHFNQQTMVLRVFDSIIHLRSAEITAIEKIESVQYHWGWADEASFYEPKALETFHSRIRKGKAKRRITSMPSEPDAFMYNFIERAEYKIYELGLKDNPDRQFAEEYEKTLRATYSGSQLKRFLDGERVSLQGTGIFATDSSQLREDISINYDDDIMLSWDFNVEYRAVSAWQIIGKHESGNDIIGCVKSWQFRNATVHDDALALADELKGMRGRIFLNGDASGESRTAAVSMSMWQTVKRAFIDVLGYERLRFVVPPSNPNVKDTILCLNWALRSGLVYFNRFERNVYASLSAARADRYGEIDKSGDYRQGSGVRSHETDTARYAVWYYFNKVYPGRARVTIV
jgi:hypothetical protein